MPYCLAQLAGAFVASAIVFAVYHEALKALPATLRDQSTAGIWATYPQEYLSLAGGLIDQVVGTALLVGVRIRDWRQAERQSHAGAGGDRRWLAGGADRHDVRSERRLRDQSSRDFGPRLFTAVAGWGPDVFRWGNGFWWVPIVGPLAGGIIGGWIYQTLVGRHHPRER